MHKLTILFTAILILFGLFILSVNSQSTTKIDWGNHYVPDNIDQTFLICYCTPTGFGQMYQREGDGSFSIEDISAFKNSMGTLCGIPTEKVVIINIQKIPVQ